MSANFWCWAPALGLIPASPDFMHRVDELHAQPIKPPAAAIVRFVDDLLKRYPDLSETEEDTAWADGPLIRDANGKFIDFSITWDYYEKVIPFVISTAHKAGINCFDPQSFYYYPATGKPEFFSKYAVLVPVDDATAAIRKARHVCALQAHGDGHWQAVLADNSWHVWFGVKSAKPQCGAGAEVQRDGSSTSCEVMLCGSANR